MKYILQRGNCRYNFMVMICELKYLVCCYAGVIRKLGLLVLQYLFVYFTV